MKLNWKTIIVGGILFYAASFIVGMSLGMVIHEGVLDPYYKATQEFWQPALNQDPPDLAALMPRWIIVGLLMSFIYAAIFDNIRSAFNGSGWMKGLKFGIVVALIYGTTAAGWSGVFNLPEAIWFWWSVEGFLNFAAGGAALGWYVGKFASD